MGITNQVKKLHSTITILWEGLRLPTKNFTLLHPVLVLSFLSSSLIFLFSYLSITPLVTDITTKSPLIGQADPGSPEFSLLLTAMIKDFKQLGILSVVCLLISFIINSLLATVTILVLSTAYNGKNPSTIKELFSRLNWSLIRGAMITQLYVGLLQLAYVFLLVLSVGVVTFFVYSYSSNIESMVIVVGLSIIAALLAFHLYLYLFVVTTTSVIISVVDEGGCYGLEAFTKAGALLQGRRRQAILIGFMESAAAGLVYFAYNRATVHAPPTGPARLAIGFVQVAIGVAFNVLVWSVHTVYYYECKKGVEEGTATKGGFMYAPVATHVDEAFP